MGLHVCQLMGYEDIQSSLRLITTHSAHALALGDQYGLEAGRPAHLLVLGADSEYDAVRRQAPVLWSICHGRVLAETRPSQTYVSAGASAGSSTSGSAQSFEAPKPTGR